MGVRPFVVAPKDYEPPLNIVGEHVTVLASGEATAGYEIFLQRGSEGSGVAREVAPVDPDVAKLAEVGARHGLKVAV